MPSGPIGPIGPQELHQLPPVTKPELMARFDEWLTDPGVTRVAVEEFVANLDNLGRDFPCECGSPLETISVEGRTDEIFRVPSSGGADVVLLPMAIATRVDEIPGVRRYQVLQTARDAFTVRLENNPGTDRNEVWRRVREGLTDFLRAQDATGVALHLAAELPQANPGSGKLRHVLKMLPIGREEHADRRPPRRRL